MSLDRRDFMVTMVAPAAAAVTAWPSARWCAPPSRFAGASGDFIPRFAFRRSAARLRAT